MCRERLQRVAAPAAPHENPAQPLSLSGDLGAPSTLAGDANGGVQADTVEVAQARRYCRSSLRAQSAPRGQTDAQGPARAGPDLRWKPCGPPRRRPPLRAPRSTRFARVALALPPPPPPRRAMTLKRQRPQPLEPHSGSGLQGAGLRPRLAADPRHHQRLGQAVQPSGARAQAGSGLPAGRAAPGPPRAPSPPPAPTTHPREGAGGSSSARRELPPRVSPVPGPPRPRGAGPGEREPGWCRPPSQPETSAKLGSPGARPASESALDPCPGDTLGMPLLALGRARGASRPPYQPSKESETAFPALRSPGHGSWKPMPKRDPGLRGRAPQSPRERVGATRHRPAVRFPASGAELQARPAPTSSASGGHAQTAPVTRPPAPLRAGATGRARGKNPKAERQTDLGHRRAGGRRGWESLRRQPWEGAPRKPRALRGGVAQPGTCKPCPAWLFFKPGHSGRVRLLQTDPKDRKGLNTPSEKVQAPPAEAAKFDKQRLLGCAEQSAAAPPRAEPPRLPPRPGQVAAAAPRPPAAAGPQLLRAREPRAPSCPALRGPRTPTGPLLTASSESLAPSGAEDAERASAPAELPLRNTLGRRTRAGKDCSCVPGVPRIRKGGVYTPLLRKSVEVGDSGQARSVLSLNYLSCGDLDKEAGKAGAQPGPRAGVEPGLELRGGHQARVAASAEPRAARPPRAPASSPARARPGGARLPSLAWGQGAIYGRRALRAPPPPPSPRRNPRRLPPPPALAPRPLRDACHLSQLHGALRSPQSPPAPVRASPAPRAPGTRSALRSLAWEGLEERPPGTREAPRACSQAATTLRGPGAKVPRVAPRIPGPRVLQPRHAPSPQPRPALPQKRRAHSGSATSAGPATREVQLCRPVASGGPHSGAGGPRRDRGRPPLAYLSLSFDGHGGAPRPRGRAHGPGRERASAHAPRCLPPREAAARRAGAERGREEVPAGAPQPAGRCAPRPQLGPSWPRWEGWGPPGCRWPDAGPSVGKPCCQDRPPPPNPAPSPGAFVTCFGQESAPGPRLAAPAGTPVQKPVPGPGRPGAIGVDACTLPSAGWHGVPRALLRLLSPTFPRRGPRCPEGACPLVHGTLSSQAAPREWSPGSPPLVLTGEHRGALREAIDCASLTGHSDCHALHCPPSAPQTGLNRVQWSGAQRRCSRPGWLHPANRGFTTQEEDGKSKRAQTAPRGHQPVAAGPSCPLHPEPHSLLSLGQSRSCPSTVLSMHGASPLPGVTWPRAPPEPACGSDQKTSSQGQLQVLGVGGKTRASLTGLSPEACGAARRRLGPPSPTPAILPSSQPRPVLPSVPGAGLSQLEDEVPRVPAVFDLSNARPCGLSGHASRDPAADP
ncbi:collagen alpha-1(I) chain-like [Moschus berezovskii]|uniref:collagen alpha-1(I) chain-like n=1 Tax=Moschus berezovskii TaxID=68408 RepID=UPI002444D639|nr:collagen alpha-1(I) chain-like [Moschus berezovskii]